MSLGGIYIHSGHVDRSCNQLTRQRKSKLQWLHGAATALSAIGSRHITHGSVKALFVELLLLISASVL